MTRFIVIPAVLVLAVACKKQVPVEPAPAQLEVAAVTEQAPVPQVVIERLIANFERVHFAYDSSALDEGSKDALARNAKILQENPRVQIEVQGHCDERGTIDYNTALGDRRATAVSDHLVLMGVPRTRITVVSYGENKPLAAGRDEVAWSQNRRAEFRLLTLADGIVGTTE